MPLPPQHLYPQGAYRNQDSIQTVFPFKCLLLLVLYTPVGTVAEVAEGVLYVLSRYLFTHCRANLVPISPHALLKCDVTEADGVSLGATGLAFRYMDCTAWESIVTNFWYRAPPSKQTSPFLTLNAETSFLHFKGSVSRERF